MRELTGKVAVVTGGASGIGAGLCRAFAAEGVKLVVADVDVPAAEKLAGELREAGAAAIAARTDVSDRASVEALAETAQRELGGAHLVCNNAGVLVGGPLLDMTPGDWRWLFSVNVDGVLNGSSVFAPLLVEQGEGHILNTASVGGFITTPELAIYSATKAAVVSFSEALRTELAPRGVGVSILCPGPVRTALDRADRLRPAAAGASGGSSEALTPFIAAGIEPREVGEIALRGIREDSEYIFTHRALHAILQQRFERVLAAFEAAPRRAGDA